MAPARPVRVHCRLHRRVTCNMVNGTSTPERGCAQHSADGPLIHFGSFLLRVGFTADVRCSRDALLSECYRAVLRRFQTSVDRSPAETRRSTSLAITPWYQLITDVP